MADELVRISFALPKKERDEFKKACIELDTSMSDLLRRAGVYAILQAKGVAFDIGGGEEG